MEHGRLLEEGGILQGLEPLSDPVNLFLVQCIIIIGICRGLGILGSYLQQPKVIFEIIGGILIGPSALGRTDNFLKVYFTPASLKNISQFANLGLILYLFLVGMELDPKVLATHARKCGGVAIMGIIVPFCLGIAISSTLFNNLQGDDPKMKKVDAVSFFVFIGTALSITAFPVLARILKETGLIYTQAGTMTMGAAAIDDAVAWCLLILAISLGNAGDSKTAGYVFLCVIAFALFLFFAVRPVWCFIVERCEKYGSASINNQLFALTLMMVFLCSFITSILGVHYVFGAFLFGLIMPRNSHLFHHCIERIEELVLGWLLPLYFALSGIKTDVAQISRVSDGAMVLLVCFVASIGKLVGAGVTARLSGMTNRQASVVAVLMNTRGLIELIVLNLGLTSGILNTRTFSVMVVMCLFTTFVTCPVIQFIYPPHMRLTTKEEEELLHGPSKKEEDMEMLGQDNIRHAGVGDYSSIAKLARDSNIAIIVDTVASLQLLTSVVTFFAPNITASAMDLTVIRVLEPSNSDKDDFIGIDSHGRILEVLKLPTSPTSPALILQANKKSAMLNQYAKEVMPLSIYGKAVGAKTRAYFARGDPLAFPSEIRSISNEHASDLLLFNWRELVK